MKTVKRISVLVMVLALVMATVFAQGSKEENKEKIILRMEQFSGVEGAPSGDALKAMIKLFEEKNPGIKVDLQTIGYNDYFTQLQSKVVGGNAADVFELNYENFVTYASQKTLTDIESFIGDTSGYNATALNAFEYNGTQYGVPNSFSNCVMFYNKDLFDKAGIAYPTDDWTWKDVEIASQKIMALGDNIWGFYRPLTFHEFYKGCAQNDGSLMSKDGKAFTVNTPENIETAEIMAGWQTGSHIMPTDAEMGGMGDWDLFKSGRLGMLVTGIWGFADFEANCSFDWDFVIEPGNKNKAAHFFSNAYVVGANSKHPNEAAKLASFLSGSLEAAQLRIDAAWELPPVTYPEIVDGYLSIEVPSNREAVFGSLDYLVTPPVVVQQNEMQTIIGDYLSKIIYGKYDAKTALDLCQAELEKKINI